MEAQLVLFLDCSLVPRFSPSLGRRAQGGHETNSCHAWKEEMSLPTPSDQYLHWPVCGAACLCSLMLGRTVMLWVDTMSCDQPQDKGNMSCKAWVLLVNTAYTPTLINLFHSNVRFGTSAGLSPWVAGCKVKVLCNSLTEPDTLTAGLHCSTFTEGTHGPHCGNIRRAPMALIVAISGEHPWPALRQYLEGTHGTHCGNIRRAPMALIAATSGGHSLALIATSGGHFLSIFLSACSRPLIPYPVLHQ